MLRRVRFAEPSVNQYSLAVRITTSLLWNCSPWVRNQRTMMAPSEAALASYEPLPSVPSTLTFPDGTAAGPGASFPPGRVATRVVIRRLRIDLPVMLQEGKQYGIYPLCDVAMYLPYMGQPGQGRATYLYAHAQPGMFWPLLNQSMVNEGKRLIGMNVEVYTSDDWMFLYEIVEVRRPRLS